MYESIGRVLDGYLDVCGVFFDDTVSTEINPYGHTLSRRDARPIGFGAGKGQLGASGAVVAPQKWSLLGGLAIYQQSVAGDDDRRDVRLLTVQPKIGRAHVCTPVTNSPLVCRLLLDKKNTTQISKRQT